MWSMKKAIYTEQQRVFIERMKELRKKAGLTQRELAEKLDVPQNTVARVEIGERRLDVLEYFQVLAILGVSPKAEVSKLTKLLKI